MFFKEVTLTHSERTLSRKNEKSVQRGSLRDGYFADILGSFARKIPAKTSGRPSKHWKNKHVGAEIHHPKARTSTTVRGIQKVSVRKLWAENSLYSRDVLGRPLCLSDFLGFLGPVRFVRSTGVWKCLRSLLPEISPRVGHVWARGTHNIGAAMSGPRIAGGKATDVRPFLNLIPYRLHSHLLKGKDWAKKGGRKGARARKHTRKTLILLPPMI